MNGISDDKFSFFSLMTVTKAAIDCHSEHDNSPTSSVVGLFFTLAETGHLTNTEYISILTTGCDLIGKKFSIGMLGVPLVTLKLKTWISRFTLLVAQEILEAFLGY